jgi:hypothetical protein
MRGGKLRLIRIVAFILVIGLALFSPLFSPSGEKPMSADMNVPQQVARVADLARTRPVNSGVGRLSLHRAKTLSRAIEHANNK